ncbi:HEAT repeat domain-containing protein [Nostoc sp. 'Peltigera membranacea cyanobiont' N6]|uniref:HEAT repeat domain-containing protein n=1 Tax=Nostoc sp. 'Peltigera membranacea cyanobiont' N6 TaxID=1261031 RepID=UPI000CF2FFE2|nr:HEAT repeat domain-containing protein [Nostoc sp. 'Peltigera membranacea cyanobiont' N6]AVH64457.1 PBS lyase HEAT domain protein repeat-containing protein [Nostoc sp. 'Peltigera membranacea cyanobiont' N6]
MSLLTQCLERILRWEQKLFPSQVSLLQPGLSDAEINQITQDWPIHLPKEVRELYKWRNGSRSNDIGEYDWIFDGFTFLPLQEISVEYQPGTEENRWNYPNDFYPNSLKIFISPEPDQGYIIVSKEGKIYWIEFGWWCDGFWVCEMYYTSLTNMMLTLAEYNEKNDYVCSIWYLSKKTKNEGLQIWYKYNSSHFDGSEIKDLLSQPSWESISRMVTGLIKFRNPKMSEFLAHLIQRIGINSEDSDIKQLVSKLIYQEDDCQKIGVSIKQLQKEYWQTRPKSKLSLYQEGIIEVENNEIDYFIDALESSDATIQRTVAFLLFMLKAVDVLILALKNNDAGIRRESVWALGQIGDSRATEQLIEALRDSNVEVREAAREAYEKMVLKFPEIVNILPF